jgi:hypothetical protein
VVWLVALSAGWLLRLAWQTAVVAGREVQWALEGRPFSSADGYLMAPLSVTKPVSRKQEAKESKLEQSDDADASAADWSSSLVGIAGQPILEGLSPTERVVLAAKWSEAARAEHASIASFARVTLQLMAAGAPASLLADTQRAAADEVRHARICFALAAAYSSRIVEPSKFPLGTSLELETDLASIAAATAAEGCFEETLSCLALAEAAHRCEDPCVRTALSSLVKDEARHAALAWRTVQWSLSQGGQSVSDAVLLAFRRSGHVVETQSEGDRGSQRAGLEKVGVLDSSTELALRRAALAAVVVPLRDRLLAKQPLELPAAWDEAMSAFGGAGKAAGNVLAAAGKSS